MENPSIQFAPFAGHVYQLYSACQLNRGAYVEVNKPWDRYGVVEHSAPTGDGKFFQNRIRGERYRRGAVPEVRF